MLQVMFLHTWEQNDAPVETKLAIATKPDGPLFRSVYPSASSVRYMPP
jgi:hypothetical protein